MRIENTPRGFGIIRFDDALDRPCSLQRSSLADEDCIWLGRDDRDSRLQVRMHLTREMTAMVLKAFQAEASRPIGFHDRYGSACVVRSCLRQDGEIVEAGITTDFEGRDGETMLLDPALASSLCPILRSFVHDGSLGPRATDGRNRA